MIVSQTELYQSYVLINNQVLSTLHTETEVNNKTQRQWQSQFNYSKKKKNKKTPSLTITETLDTQEKEWNNKRKQDKFMIKING